MNDSSLDANQGNPYITIFFGKWKYAVALRGSKTIPKSRFKTFCFGITEIEMLSCAAIFF